MITASESPSPDNHYVFHSPNNGTFSSISLPREVLEIVNELNGQKLPLGEAVQKIKCAINIKKYKIRIHKGSIVLKEDSSLGFRFWCLIKFRAATIK